MRHAMLCLLSALIVVWPVLCHAHTLTVDCAGGGDYLTIQEAVNVAAAGDTISIAACVYEEQVLIPDIGLVMVGEGASATEITWSGAGSTLEFQESDLALYELAVRHTGELGYAITWDEQMLTLSGCEISGRVDGGLYYGEVHVHQSQVEWLRVSGGVRESTVDRSRLGYAEFLAPWQNAHSLISSDSRYNRLVPCLSRCAGDTIGHVALSGADDSAQYVEATACRIDTCIGWYSAPLDLNGCEIGVFQYEVAHPIGPLCQLYGCLFTEDVDIIAYYVSGRPQERRVRNWGLEHNTILGELLFDMATSEGGFSDFIRSNIVVGPAVISCDYELTVSHNDFAGGLSLDAPFAQVEANISEDPLFCDAPLDDYTLHEDSPCNGAAHDGGVIGAYGVGCGVPVEQSTWGSIKARFR